MMLSKQKEALMEVRRQLVEGAGKAGLPIRTSIGKVTADQLESYVRAFRSDWDLCVSHAGLLQLGLATVQALRSPLASHRDTLLGAEKLLLQSLRNGDIPKVLLQLCSRLQHSGGHDDFSPLDIILLLTYVYSLSGAEALNGGEEQELAEADLCKALFHALGDSCHLWGSLEDGTGEMSAAEEKDTWLRGLFVKLRGVAQAPSSLHHFRIYEQGDSTHQALYHPLIKQVLDEALSTEQAESSDLEHMTSGLTDLLKTGFGMFMKVTRPKPSDHPLIIIFVLGGVTPGEVKLVRDTLMTRKPSHQVSEWEMSKIHDNVFFLSFNIKQILDFDDHNNEVLI
uniref:Sec1 family domain-containing protein 2 n=1 Tax=Eptatretus burgeri TaxID=7764 RepID=A0A8C4R6Y4_EPTBU